MADSESDTSDSGIKTGATSHEQFNSRIKSLEQANRVLKIELDTYKLRCKALQTENKELRRASVNIQQQAEQEEEYISNTLMKKIQSLKKEKEKLAVNYEQEEEFLTNDLSRKLTQLRQEKVQLEQTLEQEQEFQVNKLIRKIEKLENEITVKQQTLEQLKREKVDLENALEQEQEALVNRLWKRMERLETEKRVLQEKLDQPVSELPSPRDSVMDVGPSGPTETSTGNLVVNIQKLRNEVKLLKTQLADAQNKHLEQMAHFEKEERQIKEENLRLQRKLLLEMERREALSRQLSESESSLEMDDERQFNEMASHGGPLRPRTASSPIPYSPSPSPNNRPISPAGFPTVFTPPSPMSMAGRYHQPLILHSTSPPVPIISHIRTRHSSNSERSPEKFVKPSPPHP